MIREIAAAVGFISKFLRTKGLMNERQLQTFSQCLQELLAEHYKHHWFPEKPCKGSGYRCIRINHKMDPLIGQAAQRIGLSSQELFQLLPSELTLWVDPYEVSYRIGEDGSICVLYEAAPAGGVGETDPQVEKILSERLVTSFISAQHPTENASLWPVASSLTILRLLPYTLLMANEEKKQTFHRKILKLISVS
ncbi:Protein BTG1 [Willisornis vidua]|uniref:Protein BTG1 n=1 Tax=Willisornis vidua TaxID=1566151 RepID=A0ABQ9DB04_9PASS|nr:Protein BTG1 [Willisornis vidua]